MNQQELAIQFRESYMKPPKPPPPEKTGGSECPKCFQPAYLCIESRQHKNSQTRRRRRHCKNCDYKMTTYEITSGEYQEYLELKDNLDNLKEEIKALHLITHRILTPTE